MESLTRKHCRTTSQLRACHNNTQKELYHETDEATDRFAKKHRQRNILR